MIRVFYEPAVEPKEHGDGGERRCYQIKKLLEQRFELIQPRYEESVFESRFKRYLSGFLFLLSAKLPLKSLKNIAIAGYSYTNLIRIRKKYKDVKYVVWESTIIHPYKFYIYKSLGLKLICFPHNIESLVKDQSSPLSKLDSLDWFNEELRAYRLNEITFTISKEEYWLLSLFNIRSLYFPYYPSVKVKEELLDIRDYRLKNASRDFILVFGSYSYSPIRNGMDEIVSTFIDKGINYRLVVAGFDSEKLLEKFSDLPENIEVKGYLSQNDLLDLLKQCKAILVNQEISSGALTKVIELQIAGIPLIINDVSTRSYDRNHGLYVYRDIKNLKINDVIDVLESPPLPLEIKDIEEEVLNTITELISN